MLIYDKNRTWGKNLYDHAGFNYKRKKLKSADIGCFGAAAVKDGESKTKNASRKS